MTDFPSIKSLLLLPVLALSTQANAQLKPMDDTALEGTVGQAYIQMDSYTNVSDASNNNNSDQISRITFGQDVKIQANADSLQLGNIGGNIDIAATNFSLGYIDTTKNTIVPFEFTDPYFEWATDATNNLTGFRIGFGEAKGILQMDLSSFSGNIDMLVNNQASGLFFNGSSTSKQANQIGVEGATCILGTTCVDLSNIQSLDVGDSTDPEGFTSDFFLSFQKADSGWLTGGLSGSTYQKTTTGFFMNIPTNNSIDISTNGLNAGTNGLAVEFIDRGVGRWNN